jgi:hypothetical protein
VEVARRVIFQATGSLPEEDTKHTRRLGQSRADLPLEG